MLFAKGREFPWHVKVGKVFSEDILMSSSAVKSFFGKEIISENFIDKKWFSSLPFKMT